MGVDPNAIDIVVVTHNSRDVIERTLIATAVASIGLTVRTWVVDNRSTDGCPGHVRERCGWVRSINLQDNRGFAAGCNQGIALSDAPTVLLLNPDCVLAPEALRRMSAYLRENPDVAGVGPTQRDERGKALPSHHRFPSLRGEFTRTFQRVASLCGLIRSPRPRTSAGVVDWVSGACMLIRRSAFEQVGAFDDGFFLYYEETDWCRRAAQLGLEIHHDPGVSVEHQGGTSVRRSAVGAGESRAASIFRSSRKRYFMKHHGAVTAFLVEALHQARRSVNWLKTRTVQGVLS